MESKLAYLMADLTRIKGKHIRRILQTKWSAPTELIEGLPNAYYCSIYVELDDASVLKLSDDDISVKAIRLDELVEIDPSEHDVNAEIDYRTAGIETIAENQLHEKYLILRNNVALFYQTGFGTHLSIKHISEILNNEIDTGVKEILKDLETHLLIEVAGP